MSLKVDAKETQGTPRVPLQLDAKKLWLCFGFQILNKENGKEFTKEVLKIIKHSQHFW